MLFSYPLYSASDSKNEELFQDNFKNATWVVSDLRSKFEIQQKILREKSFIESNDVLRASELWQTLLRRFFPQIRILSSDIVRSIVKDKLVEFDLKLGANSDQVLCDFMDQMAPIIFHPQGVAKFNEWLTENNRAMQRLGDWVRLAAAFSNIFISQKKIAPAWITTILAAHLDENKIKNIWDRKLIFDLGSDISQSEVDIIKIISKLVDCCVLIPEGPVAKKYDILLRPYNDLKTYKVLDKKTEATSRLEYAFRFSGMLAEIKHAVATARSWLEQGIKPENIFILAADIESYWPVLHHFFKIEGIPVNKQSTTRLHSMPEMRNWISNLKVNMGEISFSDLETVCYHNLKSKSFSPIRTEDFYALFKSLLGPEDLNRKESIKSAYEKKYSSAEKLSLDEFLAQAIKAWDQDYHCEWLEVALKELLMKGDQSDKLQFSTWIFYLESILSKKEILISEAQNDGVIVTTLLSGDSKNAKRRIFLGLTDSQFKKPALSMILPQEILSFNLNYGFYLPLAEVNQNFFEIEWLATAQAEEDHFCFPATRFDGTLETPLQFWMAKRFNSGKRIEDLDLPQLTRWDEIQNENFLCRDHAVQVKMVRLPTLSASSFEKYRKCPFVFYAEKILQLKSPSQVDLDWDKMTKGSLSHALLEKLLQDPLRLNYEKFEIEELIESLKLNLKLPYLDQNIWPGTKEKYTQMAFRFLAAEKEWRAQYPQSKTIARELNFEFEFADFIWKGKIDRIDSDGKSLVLLDYKSSSYKTNSWSKWLSENELQLAIYTWVLEEFLFQQDVVAAFYYVLKNMDRSTGFKLKDIDCQLYDVQRKKSQISKEEKAQLMSSLKSLIEQSLQQIKQGNFTPDPSDSEICNDCQWRKLCRAPHLS